MGRPKTQRDPSPGEKATRIDRLYASPGRLLAIIALAAFVSETLVMKGLGHFDLLDGPYHHFFDALLLVILLFPVLYVLVFRPIKLHLDRRLKVEDELMSERNKLRDILDTLPVGVCIVAQDYRITYANSALEQEFGPVQGKCCYEYFRARQDACPICQLADIRAGRSATWEWTAERFQKTYEIFDTPLRNADGSVARLSLVWDVTARKQADKELRASRERLRSLSDHLQRTREEERTAISREIHDELGQMLAAIRLSVSSLIEDFQDHPPEVDKVAEVEKLIAGGIKTVQDISARLRPAILDDLGLAEAVAWQVNEFKRRSGIDCGLDLLMRETDLGGDVATAIFRICQEALTNVIHHAGATRVRVLLEEKQGRIVLVVKDNGRGIPPEQLNARGSLGLTGMRERAYMLGGRVRIRSFQEGGTLIIARIPLHAWKEERPSTP